MQATITTTGEEIEGKTIKDIRAQLNAMLSVDGPRGLTAVTDGGTEIHVELYDGQDYIKRPYRQGRTARAPEARLTPAELADLRRILERRGVTFSEWIRSLIKQESE